MDNFIAYFIGLIIGCILTNLIYYFTKPLLGVLKIDHSNSEKDIYRIEIYDMEKISNKKQIILKIDNNADLSQK